MRKVKKGLLSLKEGSLVIRMMPMMRKMSTLTCPGVLPATLSLQVLLQPHVLLIAMIRIIMIINDDYQDETLIESARELLIVNVRVSFCWSHKL